MNGTRTAVAGWAPVHYPSSDGEPMAESEAHMLAMAMLIVLLRQHFHERDDVFVIGNMFWYYEEGNPLARKAPDLMVVKGVDPSPRLGRQSFKSWDERANPCFILELTSPGTAAEDKDDKLELYQRLGVREYFLFDSTSRLLDRPLVGYRLMQGIYEPLVPAADGSLPSHELGLRFVPKGPDLALIDMRSGRRLEDLAATAAQLRHVQEELDLAGREVERVRRSEEDARQELARQREEVVQAIQRAEAAEAEIQRLKAVLAVVQQPNNLQGPSP
jgi:Uma2 family endonuclease